MTHRIVVNVQTGEITQVEYTPEEQAIPLVVVDVPVPSLAEQIIANPTELAKLKQALGIA
jgi:hypothetical protein